MIIDCEEQKRQALQSDIHTIFKIPFFTDCEIIVDPMALCFL